MGDGIYDYAHLLCHFEVDIHLMVFSLLFAFADSFLPDDLHDTEYNHTASKKDHHWT